MNQQSNESDLENPADPSLASSRPIMEPAAGEDQD